MRAGRTGNLRVRLDRISGRLPKPLTHKVERDHRETDEAFRRRRQVVTGVGLAGAGLLGVSLSSPPGSKRFYLLTLGVAGTWLAGALRSGPLYLGWIETRDDTIRRPVAIPILTGVAAFGVFYAGAHSVRHIPGLNDAVARIMQFADRGSPPLVLLTTCANGMAEEVYFRGALYSAVGANKPVLKSTAAYTAATLATRNPALVLASSVMGTVFGLQRRASGGIQASTLTHLTWSILMLRYIPPLFRERAEHRSRANP